MPDGSWIDAEPIEGTFIVKIGNMMELWSGGRFKSTMHRVNLPPDVERYSIGYFAVPDFDTVISPLVPLSSNVDTGLPASIHAGEDFAGFIAICDGMATA